MRKLISIVSIIVIMIVIFPTTIKALEENDLDFTDAIGNESGKGWTWNNDTNILTLSGVNFDKGIILPADSMISIVSNTINIINTIDTVPITTSGELTIFGKGKLSLETKVDNNGLGLDTLSGVTNLYVENVTLTTNGLTGLNAENVSIKNSVIDIYGYRYGIKATTSSVDKKISVNLINSTGTITGKLLQGIEIINLISGDVELNINNCNNLIISGNTTNKRLSGIFERSGARLYTMGAKSNATVNIKESKGIYFYGTNTGLAIDCHSDDPSILSGNGKASLVIDHSTVIAETVTNTWAAFFINNNGVGIDASSKVLINNSYVKALAPNDVAIMTSTKKTLSEVTVRNSILELAGKYAGIRAKSNTSLDAEIYVIENSLIVVVDKVISNYKALDEMDNAVSSDGLNGVDENSVVVSPKDCEIVLNDDGSWEIPDEGTIFINGQEKNFPYGGVIKENGDVLSYITSLNNTEFIDLNDALSAAESGDNVVLMIADNVHEAILPLGVKLTSPIRINVITDEYGYKILEEIIDENYVYSVIQKEKFKVTYHLNHTNDSIIVKEFYEDSNIYLSNNIFEVPEGMKFHYWIIDDKKYYPKDTYYITEDIDVYAQWLIKENPKTFDNILSIVLIAIVSVIGLILSCIYLFRIKKENGDD